MARATRKLRCRFCDWKCPVWYRNKRGRNVSGWALLLQHVTDRHEKVPVDIEAVLGNFVRGLED
ncbi:MAG: hypothetical protein Q8S13_12460 [Dehalococcoidia bacterium]|nr:hypothetical protein [Dehalococcoidia bacterium]